MRATIEIVKSALLFAALVAAPLAAQSHAELSQVQTVYILRMRAGFDQHLANRLTNAGIFRVVTDPSKADAVLTDHVGRAFEEELKKLYPPPPEPEPVKPEPEAEGALSSMPSIRQSERPRSNVGTSSASTIFVVDRRNNQVLWSTYARPKSQQTKDLDNTAGDVVKRLQEALQGPK